MLLSQIQFSLKLFCIQKYEQRQNTVVTSTGNAFDIALLRGLLYTLTKSLQAQEVM